ncbi:hypothetical protein HYDPIDRAFT_117933 [Hydnomerulius pinastri MD-312]|uniref:Uncharacterized protein n=1 Tax=Hydnomerulius pinastri MD-312 TaxID=994086 RepID=A0A0C9W1Q5_9AGAM|nr:hypothetical protein HYDPIDRAFT_117933 [Hydnomerulius pinastri MD-312]
MSDNNPPPYSLAVGPALQTPGEHPAAARPFNDSRRLAVEIQALILDGQSLDGRFYNMHNILSMTAFESQESVLVFCQTFESLLWGSRQNASIALGAVKEFNENILDFLAEPDITAQARMDELTGAWKVMREKGQLVAGQKHAFDSLLADLSNFSRMIYRESYTSSSKRRREIEDTGVLTKIPRMEHDIHRQTDPPNTVPLSRPSNAVSPRSVFGTVILSTTNYALSVEKFAEDIIWSSFSCLTPPPGPDECPLSAQMEAERKRPNPNPTVDLSRLAALPVLVDGLLRDLRVFSERIGIFGIIFGELQREHDIFVLYLKDGQSVIHQGYRSEINRLRKHLLQLCNALDGYSKARRS